ncbi:protein involved in polysaccharide export, contains SLBB domain of the beta-grasp fold [Lutibacter oricola]|uniref:Protein involved in polysaccharide export, contains SLBB domain of the beta-grasp fold n=1 Tax=Lutibacter oricola TaxID=762486 RepID=A0A1H2TPW0_9FLAO|nr:SLBB domain-containing protein [Lutibacter oricola]SDW45299.1 protein involved in polysaccharide export, contains SLBB domain of the beta-grasp fold [Lutibacter oricola]
MKYLKSLIIVAFLFVSQFMIAQGIDASQLSKINVDDLSDAQIESYWNRAKEQGYSISQLEVIAASKGMSATQISKLKQRINSLGTSSSIIQNSNVSIETTVPVSDLEKFGLTGGEDKNVEKSLLFGYDFFSNPNISFTPNLNVATPASYQIGPGDELMIDIWGAAENTYKKVVGKDGAIRIESIGPVYVSGLSIDKAKAKITSYLKRIYSGISASNGSYNKVYAEISLANVRTVQVNIIGEVKVPGTYSLSALSSVLNALYAAGGPTENGTFREIKIVRSGQTLPNFDIYKYLIQGDEEGNVLLRDQDIIIVQPYVSKIKVEGSVKRPGVFELKKGETISDLVSYFSGFTSNAYKNRIIVERVNGTQKEISEVVFKETPNFLLNDGDKITIGRIVNRFENRVSIGGAIYRPGYFELTKDLKLSALINKAEGVKENAFTGRGIIYRTIDDVNQEMVSFSVKDILSKASDLNLKREDSVHIFKNENLKEEYTLSIDGAVNNPQTIPFIEKMQIEDFIAVSGGFTEGADVNVIDISRRINDDRFETISKNISKSTTKKLNSKDDFYLEPFDKVSVRYLKGYTKQRNVSVKGEVIYPGAYSIGNKDERVSDLLEKAGGLSPYAYIKGATLIRKTNKLIEKEQLNLLNEIGAKDSLVEQEVHKKELSIGVDLKEIMNAKGKKSKYDLILEEGDVLFIPTEKQTVEVRGEVLAPTIIRFDKKQSFKEYINGSGGFSESAKKSKTYVVYANGDVKSTRNFLFFKSYPKIEPGAVILVPHKAAKRGTSIQEIIGISTALGTLGLLINSFNN